MAAASGRGTRAREPLVFDYAYVSSVIFVILCTTVCVDKFIVPLCKLQHKLLQCLIDNGGHTAISAEIWLSAMHSRSTEEEKQLYCDRYMYLSDIRVKELACACLLGSALDADHFISALFAYQSLSLQAATALPSRPGGHALLFVLVAMGICFLLATVLLPPDRRPYRYRLSLLVGSSLLSHQLRDATRRGLWLYPLPAALPLSYPIYLMCLAGLVCTIHGLAMNVSCFSYRMMAEERGQGNQKGELFLSDYDMHVSGIVRKRQTNLQYV